MRNGLIVGCALVTLIGCSACDSQESSATDPRDDYLSNRCVTGMEYLDDKLWLGFSDPIASTNQSSYLVESYQLDDLQQPALHWKEDVGFPAESFTANKDYIFALGQGLAAIRRSNNTFDLERTLGRAPGVSGSTVEKYQGDFLISGNSISLSRWQNNQMDRLSFLEGHHDMGQVTDILVHDDLVYLYEEVGGLDVARINASNAIERVYNLPLPHTRLMVAKGDYIYTIGNSTDAITEDRQTGINVLDITTREIPKLIKTIPIDNINKMDILQWQNQLVVAADSTLYFFDISDPENPRDDGFMDLSYLTYGPENIRPKPKKLVLLDDNKMAVAFSCLGWMIFDLENRTIIKHFVK